MNYEAHYSRLIERARQRCLSDYCERHHVTPKCIGGGDDAENIVMLTPEEHYIAHLLLARIHRGNHRVIWAAIIMTGGTSKMRRNNKCHGWLRRIFAEKMAKLATGRTHSKETLEKLRAAKIGKKRPPHSEETKRKMREAALGKRKSEEHRAAMSMCRVGKKLGPHSPETIEKIRQGNLMAKRDMSHRRTPEYREHQSQKMREVWSARKALLPS